MEISPSEYNRFRQILESQSGILLGDNKQYLVASRLSNFIKENQILSLSALLEEIARPTGKNLLQKVIDQMTTNETLWFRDSYPFDYMKRHLIPELKKNGRFRIWCAACSSGQEPYSLAMLLDELSASNSCEITATDLSSRILEKAKQGSYQEIELKRGLPNDKLRRYFKKNENDHWQVNQSIKKNIRFQSLNLLSMPYNCGKFEVIFCRNVLIYFSQDNKTKVLNSLIRSLKPGGYLFLGASESLTKECEPMEMVRCNPGLVYRKK
jgi:chemotaxis protein methyltransferase CheR